MSENDPIFPVVMQPRKIEGNNELLMIYIDYKTNVPNVMYFDTFEFLLKEMEVKIELGHIAKLSRFAQGLGEILGLNLTEMH